MSTTIEDLLERVERLEDLGPRVARLERRTWTPPAPALRERPAPAPPAPVSEPVTAAPLAPPPPPPQAEPRSLEDVLGGRVLAWAGGLAVLAGVVLLFAMAVSRGWLGEGARTLLASAGALALGALGVWLQERRARTDAAVAAVAAASGALFVAVTVATRVYGLVPAGPGIALALAVGAATTALALRWDAPVIGALGLLGGVAAPLLTGAPDDAATIAVLAVATGAATVVCVYRDWAWLSASAFALAVPQVADYVLDAAGVGGIVAALVGFGALSATAAAGHDLRRRADQLRGSSAFLICAGAVTLAVVGWMGLERASGTSAADGWLVALAFTYLAAGIGWRQAQRAGADLALLSLTLGVVLADVAVARLTSGLPSTLAWLGGSLACAALARRCARSSEVQVAELGLGAHLGLGVLQALGTDASPFSSTGPVGAAMLLAIAATCIALGRLTDERRPAWRPVLDLVAMAAVSYLTALTADGVVLAAAWAAESAALAALWRRTGEGAAGVGAAANLVLALGHATLIEAPVLSSLGGGVSDLAAAIAVLGATTAAAVVSARCARDAQHRLALGATAAATGLYLLSVTVVTIAGPAGQPALSATWGVTGVAALLVGLSTDRRPVRLGALGLLGLAAAKVFVLDLAQLDALPRVASFLALGLLLLAGAFAWQRARPARRA